MFHPPLPLVCIYAIQWSNLYVPIFKRVQYFVIFQINSSTKYVLVVLPSTSPAPSSTSFSRSAFFFRTSSPSTSAWLLTHTVNARGARAPRIQPWSCFRTAFSGFMPAIRSARPTTSLVEEWRQIRSLPMSQVIINDWKACTNKVNNGLSLMFSLV